MKVFSPRDFHLYAAAQNRPALLVETHSLKSARTRAWAHYDIMRHAFDIITAQAEELRRSVRALDREAAANAGNTEAAPLYLDGRVNGDGRPAVYHGLKAVRVPSEITGSPVTRYLAEPDNFQTVFTTGSKPPFQRACRLATWCLSPGGAWPTGSGCMASRRSA